MGQISLLFQKNKSDKWKAFSFIRKQIWLTEALLSPALRKEWAAQFSVAVQTEVMKPCPVSVILCCSTIQNFTSFSFGFSKDITLLY